MLGIGHATHNEAWALANILRMLPGVGACSTMLLLLWHGAGRREPTSKMSRPPTCRVCSVIAAGEKSTTVCLQGV